jgi:hypothetical protein
MSDKRPIYETQAHLDQERTVLALLTERWQCDARKLPYSYSVDFAFTRNHEIAAFCEIKSTKYKFASFAKYGGYLLGLNKWNAAKALCTTTSLPFFLVIEDPDKQIWYLKTEHFNDLPLRYYGAYKRNDGQDIEPCVVIGLDKFTKF